MTSDDVILLEHSTGGLDIRWLLWDLHQRKEPIVVDGGAKVKPREILERVRRVVFLSVPHWGTNIADWVRAHTVLREAAVGELRAAVAGSQLPPVDRIEKWITGSAASLTGSGLLQAVQDALSEANEHNGKPGPARRADAYEAASELGLYLRLMASDFRAIDDLTSQPPPSKPMSPAHFGNDERTKELKLWDDLIIEARSYVTLGRRPFRFDPGRPAPPWELANLRTYPELAKGCQTECRHRLRLSRLLPRVRRPPLQAPGGKRQSHPAPERVSPTSHRAMGQRRHRQHSLHALASGRKCAGSWRPLGHCGTVQAGKGHSRAATIRLTIY